ncbi:MAG TPA: hypothetical protein VNJ01_17505 [Bacteriovoracaceae bacterium]|nr:hypothetical protein [Bacteriovoracaceae bacterium]
MKTMITFLALSFASLSFATTEKLFDRATMDQCRAEVNKLDCGNAETAENNKLMDCVEQKKSQLSKDCLNVHNAMNEMRKGHAH